MQSYPNIEVTCATILQLPAHEQCSLVLMRAYQCTFGIDKDSSSDVCNSQEGYMCQLAFQDHINMLPRELFMMIGNSSLIQYVLYNW